MGSQVMLSFSAAHRKASGFAGGRDVTVSLTLDDAPREVDIPGDLDTAFASAPDARSFFDGLASSYQRNFVAQIEAAKTAETRDRRIATTIEKLAAGQKR